MIARGLKRIAAYRDPEGRLYEKSAVCTHLKCTEQGAFLNGYDDAGSRERGTGGLIDRLASTLAEG